VQEALTNARQHAPAARVDVELSYSPENLTVPVRDNGPGPTVDMRAGAGHGWSGCASGSPWSAAGSAPGAADRGGFLVEASLPIGEAAR
jgi:glucose-6-phosphate-specific signal transduction histidine kinase